MGAALELFLARAPVEEGVRKFAYNDATGKTVTCQPGGNLSIGEGINLETGLDPDEIAFLTRHRAGLVEATLQTYSWYVAAGPTRQSVALDIGFNAGIGGLLHFPHMIAAYAAQDWTGAANECAVADPKLDAQRYAPLRALILKGDPT
jgi:GH24 family phage-related lysozyme (muramidase)